MDKKTGKAKKEWRSSNAYNLCSMEEEEYNLKVFNLLWFMIHDF